MTKNITSMNDLRNWADSALGADATPTDSDMLAEIIRDDPRRPQWDAYGEWDAYLESLGDVWQALYEYEAKMKA